jgi:hypothetical protein
VFVPEYFGKAGPQGVHVQQEAGQQGQKVTAPNAPAEQPGKHQTCKNARQMHDMQRCVTNMHVQAAVCDPAALAGGVDSLLANQFGITQADT